MQLLINEKPCRAGRLRLVCIMAAALLMTFLTSSAHAVSTSNHPADITAAAVKLVTFCNDPQKGLDMQAAATLIDYVLEPKTAKDRETDLPKIENATGAYYEFDTRISFVNFLQYAYSSKIPSALTSPSSLRYSLWKDLPGEWPKLPENWKLPAHGGKPVIVCGMQRDAITPDLTTGVYYEYDLKRTLVLLQHKGRYALISISKQIDISDVGKKGFILGSDDDWNYYYSDVPGSAKAGLGWVKSYIYNFFSVGIYVESGSSPAMVRTGNFQWIRAGWSGVNFVQTQHVIKGMKRHTRNFKTILESPNLPPPSQIASTQQRLSDLPQQDLIERYNALRQARQSLAIQSGKITAQELPKPSAGANPPRRQIVEELMVEYLKIALGKPSLVGRKALLSIN